ncbi:MAG: hypothetical protein IT228_03325 [Flavobacteriales bacterium]|nr:hypothetical protein [Flavobacteriales bacterium]MCC6576353.1 hypothetical protein [Flavobacteriales bacterium]NUQ14943.1 hypothetical protein [Flavobacteriales bacterium]
MEEHFIRVGRTARYHQLGDPRTAPRLWVVVHGYGQLARYFLNAFAPVAGPDAVVAPEGLNRFYLDAAHQRVGATWMTREDREHEIQDHVRYLDTLVDLLQPTAGHRPLHVLGFSQGVATVVRWLVHGTHHPRQAVLWGGSLPPELKREDLARAFAGCNVDLVHGEQDHLVPQAQWEQGAERLTAAGIAVRRHLFQGGHILDPVVLRRCFG